MHQRNDHFATSAGLDFGRSPSTTERATELRRQHAVESRIVYDGHGRKPTTTPMRRLATRRRRRRTNNSLRRIILNCSADACARRLDGATRNGR